GGRADNVRPGSMRGAESQPTHNPQPSTLAPAPARPLRARPRPPAASDRSSQDASRLHHPRHMPPFLLTERPERRPRRPAGPAEEVERGLHADGTPGADDLLVHLG